MRYIWTGSFGANRPNPNPPSALSQLSVARGGDHSPKREGGKCIGLTAAAAWTASRYAQGEKTGTTEEEQKGRN